MYNLIFRCLLVLGGITGYLLMFQGVCGAEQKEFNLNVSVKEEYTDNVFLSARDNSTDWITTLSPGARFSLKTEQLDTAVSATLDALAYADNDSLNDIEQNYEGRISYLFSPQFRMRTDASFIKDSRVDRDISVSGLTAGSVRRQRQHYLLGGDYMLSEIASMNLNYDFYQDTYDDPEFSDYRAHLISGGLSYSLDRYFANTTARSSLGYGSYEFLTSTVKNYTLTAGFRKLITEIWSLDVDAGVRSTHSEFINSRQGMLFEDSSDDFGGMGSLGINYKGEVTSGSLIFSHDVQPASGRESTTKRTALKFNVFHRLTEDFKLGLWTEYFMNEADSGSFGTAAIDETTFQLSPLVSYEITKEIRLDCRYLFTSIKDGGQNDNDRERNLIFVKMYYTYPLFE